MTNELAYDAYIPRPDAVSDYIETSADWCDMIAPGLGNVFKAAWNQLAPNVCLIAAAAVAATSGADTELDYYTDGDRQ